MVMPQEGKVVVQLVESIKGEKLNNFIDFCFSISDEISLNTISSRQMMKEEVKVAINQLCKYLKEQGAVAEEIKERTESYYEKLEEEATQYMQTKRGLGELMNRYLGDYNITKREVTCRTHCTQGSPTVVYYFENEEKIHAKFKRVETIFDWITLDEESGFRLEDPAFYKGEQLICSICSHEKMGTLLLDEEEYKVFRNLRIPHDVWTMEGIQRRMNAIVRENTTYYPVEAEVGESTEIKDKEVENLKLRIELVEILKEYAYQERESVTLHGWEQESIPTEIGDIKTLKNLEIFDHTVKYLPRSLEKLTELECLRMTGNQVEELCFDIAKLQKLKVLDLSGMPLKKFPKGIVQLQELEILYLSGEYLQEIPEEIMALKNLKVLSIDGIDLENMPQELTQFIEDLNPKRFWVDLMDIEKSNDICE